MVVNMSLRVIQSQELSISLSLSLHPARKKYTNAELQRHGMRINKRRKVCGQSHRSLHDLTWPVLFHVPCSTSGLFRKEKVLQNRRPLGL